MRPDIARTKLATARAELEALEADAKRSPNSHEAEEIAHENRWREATARERKKRLEKWWKESTKERQQEFIDMVSWFS